MEVASLVLGIIAIVISFIPFIGMFAYVPAIVGIILGIVSLATMKSRGKNNKAMPIVGIVTSGLSMILAIVLIFVFAFVGSVSKNIITNGIRNEIFDDYDDYYDDYDYDNDYDYDYDYDDDDDISRLNNYSTVTIDKIERYKGSENLQAYNNDYELVMVTITIKNTDDTPTYISKYDFSLVDRYGEDYDPMIDYTYKEATLDSKLLEVGESVTGTLCFQKMKNDNNCYIVYSDMAKIKVNI